MKGEEKGRHCTNCHQCNLFICCCELPEIFYSVLFAGEELALPMMCIWGIMNSYNPSLPLDRELMVIAGSSGFTVSEFRLFREGKRNLTTVVLSYYTALNMTLPASLWISRHWLNGGHQHTSEYQGVYLSLAEISPPWGGAEQKRVSIPLPSLLKIHTGFHILPFISQKKIAKEMKSSPLTRICFSAFIAALDKKQLSHPVV